MLKNQVLSSRTNCGFISSTGALVGSVMSNIRLYLINSMQMVMGKFLIRIFRLLLVVKYIQQRDCILDKITAISSRLQTTRLLKYLGQSALRMFANKIANSANVGKKSWVSITFANFT